MQFPKTNWERIEMYVDQNIYLYRKVDSRWGIGVTNIYKLFVFLSAFVVTYIECTDFLFHSNKTNDFPLKFDFFHIS